MMHSITLSKVGQFCKIIPRTNILDVEIHSEHPLCVQFSQYVTKAMGLDVEMLNVQGIFITVIWNHLFVCLLIQNLFACLCIQWFIGVLK